MRRAVETEGLPTTGGVAAEAAHPDAVVQDNQTRRIWALPFLRRKTATQRRRDSQRAKVGLLDELAGDAFRRSGSRSGSTPSPRGLPRNSRPSVVAKDLVFRNDQTMGRDVPGASRSGASMCSIISRIRIYERQGLKTAARTSEKIATFAPRPNASISTAIAVNAGCLRENGAPGRHPDEWRTCPSLSSDVDRFVVGRAASSGDDADDLPPITIRDPSQRRLARRRGTSPRGRRRSLRRRPDPGPIAGALRRVAAVSVIWRACPIPLLSGVAWPDRLPSAGPTRKSARVPARRPA